MPYHRSPRIVAQQVYAELLRESLAPPDESRNPTVHQPKLLALEPRPRICSPRAKSFADVSNEGTIDQEGL
jgi:hypothetical protein